MTSFIPDIFFCHLLNMIFPQIYFFVHFICDDFFVCVVSFFRTGQLCFFDDKNQRAMCCFFFSYSEYVQFSSVCFLPIWIKMTDSVQQQRLKIKPVIPNVFFFFYSSFFKHLLKDFSFFLFSFTCHGESKMFIWFFCISPEDLFVLLLFL